MLRWIWSLSLPVPVYLHIWQMWILFLCPTCGFLYDPSLAESVSIGGGHQEDVTACWPTSWTHAVRLLTLLLSLECMFCPPFPQCELFQGHSLETVRCCWDHVDGICDWTKLRPLHKLSTCGEWAQVSTCLVVSKTSLLYRFPYLLNWHLLIWSGPPLRSLHSLHVRGPVCEQTGNLRFRSNIWVVFRHRFLVKLKSTLTILVGQKARPYYCMNFPQSFLNFLPLAIFS